MFIEILFKIVLFKGGVPIYAEHCIYIYIYLYSHVKNLGHPIEFHGILYNSEHNTKMIWSLTGLKICKIKPQMKITWHPLLAVIILLFHTWLLHFGFIFIQSIMARCNAMCCCSSEILLSKILRPAKHQIFCYCALIHKTMEINIDFSPQKMCVYV